MLTSISPPFLFLEVPDLNLRPPKGGVPPVSLSSVCVSLCVSLGVSVPADLCVCKGIVCKTPLVYVSIILSITPCASTLASCRNATQTALHTKARADVATAQQSAAAAAGPALKKILRKMALGLAYKAVAKRLGLRVGALGRPLTPADLVLLCF